MSRRIDQRVARMERRLDTRACPACGGVRPTRVVVTGVDGSEPGGIVACAICGLEPLVIRIEAAEEPVGSVSR